MTRSHLTGTPEIEHPRPEPPSYLVSEESEIWREIVQKMPADWFPVNTHPLLANLCRHTALCRRFGRQLMAITEKPPADTRALSIIADINSLYVTHSRMVNLLSMRLRLTMVLDHSVRQRAIKAARAERKPWEMPSQEELAAQRELADQQELNAQQPLS